MITSESARPGKTVLERSVEFQWGGPAEEPQEWRPRSLTEEPLSARRGRSLSLRPLIISRMRFSLANVC